MADPQFYFFYKGMYVARHFCTPESLQYWEEFTFRPDDVIVATYPKSGTHWSQEIVPLIMNGGDPTIVDTVLTWERCPAVGHIQAVRMNLENRPPPRIMSSHFHYSAMPQSFFEVKPKVINVMRNPKDILTSAFYYNAMCQYHADPGTPREFLHKFLEGHVPFSSWFDHVKSWLNAEDKSHILYITYEEMLLDLPQCVSRMAEFLGKPLDAEVIDKIADKCLFKNMKKNNMSNYKDNPLMDHSKSEFLRKGVSGDWKNLLSVEEAQLFDAVYKEKMKDVDFKFIWD